MRLKWLVILTVVGVQLAAAALVVGVTWQAVADGVSDNARESMHRLGRAARDRFQRFVAPAEATSRLLQRLIGDHTLTWSDADRLERFLAEPLRLHPAFDAVYFGLSDGTFLFVRRDAAGTGYLIKEIQRRDGVRQVTFRHRDQDGRLLETWEDPEDIYDPRLRPWFSAATDVETARWTAPYRFFTSGRAGVSAATAMAGPEGVVSGAVAVDIELGAFESLLGDLSTASEFPFIVDRDGTVVALPERRDGWSALFQRDALTGRMSVADGGFRDLVGSVGEGGGQGGAIDLGGRTYWFDLQAFDSASSPWLMVVAVPADALFGWVHTLRDRVIVVTVAMALMASVLILVAWRFGIERPIVAVTARLRRITDGQPDSREVLKGPGEFRELDAAALEAAVRIAEREQSNQQLIVTLREYEHAVQQSPVGIAILEPDGRVVFANQTYRRLVGPEDPRGAVSRLFASDDGPVAPGWRSVREDVKTCRADDGSAAVLQCVVAPFRVEDVPAGRSVLIVEDVTGRKQVEDSLIDARNAAERSDRAKTSFLSQMSHELRTPLNAIIGFSEVMRCEMFGAIGSPRYAEYVGHIESSAKHLKELIDRVLDLSRIEQGAERISLQQVDPVVPVRGALDMVAPAAAAAGVTLDLEIDRDRPPSVITADPVALRQIVLNLVSNAVKFSPRGARVTTVLGGTAQGGVEIVVTDTGVGIPVADLPHVFEPFWQGGSAWDAGRAGVGLGLAIVRSLVDLHGGVIDLDSAPGTGTTVRVRLPAAPVGDGPATHPGG